MKVVKKKSTKIPKVGDTVKTELIKLSQMGKVKVTCKVKEIDITYGHRKYLLTDCRVEDYETRIIKT